MKVNCVLKGIELWKQWELWEVFGYGVNQVMRGKIEIGSELREESGLDCDSELIMEQLVLKVNEFWK